PTPSYTLFPYTTLFRSYQPPKTPAATLMSQQLLDEWAMFRNDREHSFRASRFLSQVGALSAETTSFRNEARSFKVPADIATEKRSEEHTSELQSRENLV